MSVVTEVVLDGLCRHQGDYLGTYTIESGRECEGRPVFRMAAENRYLFFCEGTWYCSEGDDVGSDSGWLYVADAALHPTRIEAGWEEFDPDEDDFVPAPKVRALLYAGPHEWEWLRVGVAVDALFGGGRRVGSLVDNWFPGVVVAEQANGNFDVEFNDGDTEEGIPRDRLRLPFKSLPPLTESAVEEDQPVGREGVEEGAGAEESVRHQAHDDRLVATQQRLLALETALRERDCAIAALARELQELEEPDAERS